MPTRSDYRAFWMCAAHEAPGQTGAATVMDLADIRDVLDNLDLSLEDKWVIDVGCGTGRLSQVCGTYKGYDVSPGCVEYARGQNLDVDLILDPEDLVETGDIVCSLSVFTHISEHDRTAYLEAFSTLAPMVLVDILPGEDVGGIPAWYTPPEQFEDSLKALYASWRSYERTSPDGETHRYYLAHQ